MENYISKNSDKKIIPTEDFIEECHEAKQVSTKRLLKGTKKEIMDFMERMRDVFDVVRVVDVEETKVIDMSQIDICTDDGMDICEHQNCFAIWERNSRCANCVSSRAFKHKGCDSKLEFMNDDIYQIISKYIEMDGKPYVMEMVFKAEAEMLLGAYGKTEFMNLISNYNKQFYLDTLTGVYSRRYYEERAKKFVHMNAVAMIDGDNFKGINDGYGHAAGDEALKTIANAIKSCIRGTDRLIRYGGDEFILLMADMPKDIFQTKLDVIVKKVGEAVIEKYPDVKLSVTIGGVHGILPISKAVDEADKLLYQAKKKKNNARVG